MSKKVLVVDDSKINIATLKSTLEVEGYTVYGIDNGREVLGKARKIKPDIILLDILMPDMDGFQVCELLKQDSELKDIPVIMLTAKVDGKDVKHGLELGAFDYIKRPADEVEVIARVNSALRYKERQDQLIEMSMKDGLTGVYNHALLLELFEKEYFKCERTGQGISFVMLDIDYFKSINDTYGHVAGDIILKELAKALTKSIRVSDIVGRYGGEEFGLVFPGVDQYAVVQICERIRMTIENHKFVADGNEIHATVSIGICYKPGKQLIGCSQMIKMADDALYKAKRNGRNRVEMICLKDRCT